MEEHLQLQQLKHVGQQLLLSSIAVDSFKGLSDEDVEALVAEFVQKLLRDSGLGSFVPPSPEVVDTPKVAADFVRAAAERWHSKIQQRYSQVSERYQAPLISRKAKPIVDSKTSRENYLETVTPQPLPVSMFVYDAQDLLKEVRSVMNPNLAFETQQLHQQCAAAYATLDTGELLEWEGLGKMKVAQPITNLKVAFQAPTVDALKQLFHRLHPRFEHNGTHDSSLLGGASLSQDRLELAREVLHGLDSKKLREFLQCGCPVSQRSVMWLWAMKSSLKNDHSLQYEQLWQNAVQATLMAEHLVVADAELMTSTNSHYFVFREFYFALLIPFTHDDSISHLASHDPVEHLPNGVVPFRGISLLIAPLAFVFRSPATAYAVFRQMYVRYFSKLHSISDNPNSILRLSVSFETLLLSSFPKLFHHLSAIGFVPLNVAFPWMFHAFAGFLQPIQVLHLWDRIIGFDSLYVLPLLAVAIFGFRQDSLMSAETPKACEQQLSSLVNISVVPLLQFALFSDDLLSPSS
eukprot:m.188990 g.188990  ORF g.188990 m.188990 type:complete len:520 (+) comp14790_c0_seq5:149-1708(+)